MLLHRRFTDFLAFVKHYGFVFFATRSEDDSVGKSCRNVSFTRMHLLRSSKMPMILPTEFAMFEIDAAKSSSDRAMIDGPLASFHDAFCAQPSYSDDVMQGCFVLVDEISTVRQYPTPRAKEYIIVTMRLLHRAFPNGACQSLYGGVLMLILFDDQVHMASLWRPGMFLWIHRPCLTLNAEEPVFGMTIENSSSHHIRGMSMHGSVIYHTATPIKKVLQHANDPSKSTNISLLPFHIIIGAITCVSLITGVGPNELNRTWEKEERKVISLEV